MPTQMVYDISKPFEENVVYGPFWTGQLPSVPQSKKSQLFLGKTVNSVFGISASPMTFGSRNILFFSKLGYDILTYRSVRSVEWHGVGYPQWRYVDIPKPMTQPDLAQSLIGSEVPFSNKPVSMANSFGIQSLAPALWQRDYEVAKAGLLSGQVLILALMITPETGLSSVADASEVAELAAETTAEIFEINLACPNSGKASLVYEDLETSVAICQAVRAQIGQRKLLAKVGFYHDPATLREFMIQTKGVIDGISSTNTYGMKVTDVQGKDLFPGRPSAGVSGDAIRQLSLQQAKTIVSLKKELDLPQLGVIGIGGVMQPQHIQQYLDLGVEAVQAAVGVYADPELAIKYKQSL